MHRLRSVPTQRSDLRPDHVFALFAVVIVIFLGEKQSCETPGRKTEREEDGNRSFPWRPRRNRSVNIVGSWDFPNEQSINGKNHYSYRRATIGSTFVARRAGM